MRKALDAHKKDVRPTVEAIVERIGPMRNKLAAPNTTETSEGRRERRRRG
jgi:5-methyltetrahydrofolate--homocysteine methyltransferase